MPTHFLLFVKSSKIEIYKNIFVLYYVYIPQFIFCIFYIFSKFCIFGIFILIYITRVGLLHVQVSYQCFYIYVLVPHRRIGKTAMRHGNTRRSLVRRDGPWLNVTTRCCAPSRGGSQLFRKSFATISQLLLAIFLRNYFRNSFGVYIYIYIYKYTKYTKYTKCKNPKITIFTNITNYELWNLYIIENNKRVF